MTYQEIESAAQKAIQNKNLEGVIALITHSNSRVLSRYRSQRKSDLRRYKALRKFKEFQNFTDEDFDNFFADENAEKNFKLIIENNTKNEK